MTATRLISRQACRSTRSESSSASGMAVCKGSSSATRCRTFLKATRRAPPAALLAPIKSATAQSSTQAALRPPTLELCLVHDARVRPAQCKSMQQLQFWLLTLMLGHACACMLALMYNSCICLYVALCKLRSASGNALKLLKLVYQVSLQLQQSRSLCGMQQSSSTIRSVLTRLAASAFDARETTALISRPDISKAGFSEPKANQYRCANCRTYTAGAGAAMYTTTCQLVSQLVQHQVSTYEHMLAQKPAANLTMESRVHLCC